MYDVTNIIETYEHTDGTWDFRIRAKENGNILCSSMQGYVDKLECHRIASRVVGTAKVEFVTLTDIA